MQFDQLAKGAFEIFQLSSLYLKGAFFNQSNGCVLIHFLMPGGECSVSLLVDQAMAWGLLGAQGCQFSLVHFVRHIAHLAPIQSSYVRSAWQLSPKPLQQFTIYNT